MARCCAGFAVVLNEANRGERSGDLFGKLKADVRVTRQTRKRSAADALRILSVTGVRILPETRLTCRARKPQAVHIFRVRHSCSSRASGMGEAVGVAAGSV